MVLTAQEATWEQVEPALPPMGFCACVNVCDIAEGGVKDFFGDPWAAFKGFGEVTDRPKPGKVMTPDSGMVTMARGLLGRGLVKPLRRHELIMIDGKPLVNGWFGVSKGKRLGPEAGSFAGMEVLRFIMNLTATNSVQEILEGDVHALPYIGQWRAICLRDGEVLLWNAEDLKGCFYIFRLPDEWAPWFAFDMVFTGAQLGISPSDELFWLGAVTLPMGWKSAMGVAQYLHRRLLTRLGGGPQAPLLPHDRELRKDRVAPFLRADRDEFSRWWQIYCDDLDIGVVCKSQEEAEAKRQELDSWQTAARQAYDHWNVPRSVDKASEHSQLVKRLGGLIDGREGCIGPDGARCGTLLGITTHVLGATSGRPHDLQVVGGNWTCVMIFAKETSGFLGDFWRYCQWPLGSWSQAIPHDVGTELLRVCALLPLMRMDLRAVPSADITVSDASEWGGGVCVSRGLTHQGRGAFEVEMSMVGSSARDEIGLISLCGGIGAARRAFELLGIELAVFVLAEIDERAVKVVTARWPGVVLWGDVTGIDDDMIAAIGRAAPHLKLLFVESGTPCQDLSGANPTGLGLSGARSSLVYSVWSLRCRIVEVLKWVSVLTLIENVQSMDSRGPQPRESFTSLIGSVPVAVCASGISEVRRPRYYWIDWPIAEGEGVEIVNQGHKVSVKLTGVVPPESCQLERGWRRVAKDGSPFSTFMRAIPRKKATFMPCGASSCDEDTMTRWASDQYRYPPYQYKLENLVHRDMEVRPLNSTERAIRMGFSADHLDAAIGRREKGASSVWIEDLKCSLVGNSYHCVVVAWLFGQALYALGVFAAAPHPTQCWGPQELLGIRGAHRNRTSGGGDDNNDSAAAGSFREQLTKTDNDEFGRLVTTHMHRSAMYRGSDVRLSTGILTNPGRWPREAVPVKRWNWRVVLSFRQEGDHINVLEMRAIAAAIRWRLRRPDGIRSRAVHLTDSQVCQSVIVKGRTSSRRLRQVVQRINSLILASGMVLAYGYVTSKSNPADRPSRWRQNA